MTLMSVQVQERALKAVPNLCETIDYAEVQGVLFPRVAVSYSYSFTPDKTANKYAVARLHKNPHTLRQSCYTGHLFLYGQDSRSGGVHF